MTTVTPYRSAADGARDGFGPLLRAEWTKFRTVRGWVAGLIIAVVLTAGLGVLVAEASTDVSCSAQLSRGGQSQQTSTRHGAACLGGAQRVPGPGGEPVRDVFYFVRQPLDGDGSLTVRVTSLAGQAADGGLAAWSKGGIIIKASTSQGSAYAAVMVTGGHGARLQWNYTGDTAGLAGAVSAASPRWLRLTRDGDTVTGYDSADGTHWTRIGSVQLAGLPSTVQAGLFATSPRETVISTSFGGGDFTGGSTTATAVFDDVSRIGSWPAGAWAGQSIGAPDPVSPQNVPGYRQAGGQFTVTGSGDIAPVISGPGEGDGPDNTISEYLYGTFLGLIVIAVVATMFMTAEYRRGLIRTTLAASPGRGRVLAAKAVVIGAAAFVTGTVAAAAAVFIATAIAHGNGFPVFPERWPTELRIIAGTGALVAVSAVLTLAAATIVRRSAAAVLISIAATAVPFFLAVTSAVPVGVANWLLRVTPAAAFALQQASPRYYQVQAPYLPSTGFYPLPPWAGFAVLCGWTVLALAGAAVLLRRRDA
jgi:ABC-type transport system involved in multi-copper enzyme maturation permease subunit